MFIIPIFRLKLFNFYPCEDMQNKAFFNDIDNAFIKIQ